MGLIDATNEVELAGAAARGDARAQETVVRLHYEGIHRLARHLSRSHSEAQDLAQLTFIKACRNMERFDGRSSLRAWLAGILVHEYSHWRRSRRLFAELRETISPDPSDQIVEREVLLKAIHRLSQKHSSVFLLVEVHGLSVAESSAAIGVPEGTIKSRLSEARILLRRHLGDSMSPEPSPKKVTHEF
jgi:RNA polymerase sigma factor (sigma-70 family)